MQYPALMAMVDAVSRQNPLQLKRIAGFIARQDTRYWEFAEDLCAMLNCTLTDSEAKRDAAARAYNALCRDMLRAQIQFRKTAVYPARDAAQARQDVYDQQETMSQYMVGLLVSQVFWPNHYQLFRFFEETLRSACPSSYLEVGAGHGLYIREAVRQFPGLDVEVCDISAASIAMSQTILASLGVRAARVRFIHGDFFTFSSDRRFDFITLGEVLEHVEDPVRFLQRARALLTPTGVVSLTTCVNCPAVDHVYHFRSVDDIRAVIAEAGFSVTREVVLPAEDVPCERWAEELVTINYGAALRDRALAGE